VWLNFLEVGVSLPIDASAIFETLPESSSSFAESNDISFVFSSYGEKP
jgi:hypothetical protein